MNYGFLLHKPVVASILDYLSDKRWLYIVELEGLALLFFALLYAPFALRGRGKERGALIVATDGAVNSRSERKLRSDMLCLGGEFPLPRSGSDGNGNERDHPGTGSLSIRHD